MDTPTKASVAGNIKSIDTRVPPATQLSKTDFATVVGKKPMVLLFATPALCKSRVCGPVEDIAAQVAAQYDGKVTFIHQEIYNNNNVQDLPPAGGQGGCRASPGPFAINKQGKVVDRLEGAFGLSAFQKAVQAGLR